MSSVQEAFVSDKLALVNVAGWERLKIKSEVQKVHTVKPKQRMQGNTGKVSNYAKAQAKFISNCGNVALCLRIIHFMLQ